MMLKVILVAKFLFLSPVETTAMLYAKCRVITIPLDPETVAVKWICPN